jgi:beta-galactosidase
MSVRQQRRKGELAMRKTNFNLDWKFSYSTGNSYGDKQGKAYKEKVNLPHDFSIGLNRAADEISNSAGGFFPGGIGTYEKEIEIQEEKEYMLVIEGAYMNAEVYVNGNLAALHPYGYTEFHVDCTPWLRLGEKNKFKIVVNNNAMPNSRWYSGSGLYRHVWLMISEKIHIKPWGVFITTPVVSEEACVNIETAITNKYNKHKKALLNTIIYDPQNAVVGSIESECFLDARTDTKIVQEVIVKEPQLWSIDKPNLYKSVSEIVLDGTVIDTVETTFGIRNISFDVKNGFQLNGVTIKLKGGCIHHDNGPIGACAFYRAEERKIKLLKDIGYNAIRTAHNPPSRALLDACDRLGMLVMDEAFDCWRLKKNPYDYHLYFEDWWKRDLEAMICRDRNHPSVIMWSIGNEIGERDGSSNGAEMQKELADYARSLDPTRAITNGVNAIFLDAGEFGGILANIFNGSAGDISELPEEVHELLKECDRVTKEWGDITKDFCEPLDVVGYNYLDSRYEQDGQTYPERIICGTESYPKMMASIWSKVEKYNHVIGDFTWTAMDYLGESGIGRCFYNETGSLFGEYPWHISNCGDLDICGFLKPQGEFRKILWGTNQKPYIAVLKPEHYCKKEVVSSWGWADVAHSWSFPDCIGKKTRVDIYSNADAVELLVNNQSVGRQPVGEDLKVSFDVVYEEGCIEARNYRNGILTEVDVIRSTKKPYSLRLTPENNSIKAGYGDISYIVCEIVDEEGQLVPYADNLVSAQVQGAGKLIAVGTGNPVSEEKYVTSSRKAFGGKLLLVVRGQEGSTINVVAQADGLIRGLVEIPFEE